MEKVDIFCGISSLGMPNTTDNKDNYGYLDYVKDYLVNKGFNIQTYNLSSLDHNYTWDLEKIFKQNYRMSQIRNIQTQSIDNLRKVNFLFKLVVPEKYKDKLKKQDNDEKIGDTFKKSSNPIFLYSTGINDMFVFMQAGPVELLNKTTRNNISTKLDDYIDKAIENVKNNWILLSQMNPEVEIYALSVYYADVLKLIDRIINLQNLNDKENILPKNLLYYIQNEFNKKLVKLAESFPNVHLIDLYNEKLPCAKLDFHPSRKGNIIIGEKIVEEINSTYLESKKKI